MLDGPKGPQNVGIMMAKRRGYFANAGLSVSISSPVQPALPVRSVVSRRADFAVTHEPQLVLAKIEGAPVIAVGSLVNQATASMIWLRKSHINSILAMKGKTIAIPGVPFQKAYLASLLALYRLTLDDVKVKRVGRDLVPALVSGRADATFGGAWNVEGAELKSRHLNPIMIPSASLGFSPYNEFMVIARPDLVAKKPGLVRDFISAVARGTVAAVEDPQAAAAAIEQSGSELSRKALSAELASTLPLLSKTGYMYPQGATRLVSWMYKRDLISKRPAPAELMTNEYVSWQP